MNLIKTALTISFILTLSSRAQAGELVVGQAPPKITLSGEAGGRTTGESWSSDEINGSKIVSIFYVDPEERKANEPLEEAYHKADFPKDKTQSIGILNMAAAWYPNSILNSQLEKKQQKYPNAIYLKDNKKLLVREWGLKDDSVNLVIFGHDGKVLYLKKGPLTEAEIKEVIELVKSKL